MRVIEPGLLTTIQDLGRIGYQRFGIITNGAMDEFALRIANLLVGNEENTGALEMTLRGPKLHFEADHTIAITGASLSPTLNGMEAPEWRPISVHPGDVLEFGRPVAGCRAYLAVSGGFDVPEVMGSQSTYLRAAIGGFEGRALKAGDFLPLTAYRDASRAGTNTETTTTTGTADLSHPATVKGSNPSRYPNWSVSDYMFPDYAPNPTIRVVEGPEFDRFTTESRERFFTQAYTVTPRSDRMGYRLQGPKLELGVREELLSSAVVTGTIQVPGEGEPILLMADHQTTGGYPRIAQVITVDLPVCAQIKPGDKVRFELVSLTEAQRLLRDRERDIAQLRVALRYKYL